MTIAESLLPEFDHEMATTRTLLERVPAADAAWKPHDKSMGLGQLAAHLASIPTWGEVALKQTEFDVNPPGGSSDAPPAFESVASLLGLFDQNVKVARATLAAASNGEMMVPWTLKNGGRAVFTMPRVGVFRSFVMNHSIHHRGQLSVYLRLRDVPLPPIYGPTADTEM